MNTSNIICPVCANTVLEDEHKHSSNTLGCPFCGEGFTVFSVKMLAFMTEKGQSPVIRKVVVPNNEMAGKDQDEILALIYRYGQNDIQPSHDVCSVSVGDVIELSNTELYVVASFGFTKIDSEWLKKYEEIERSDRYMFASGR